MAGFLVAAVSVLSGAQYALQGVSHSSMLLMLSGAQAALAIGAVLAMRTQLRRYAAAVAFAFLLLTPIVPLATLRIHPASIVLISASLALIPIAVALFIAWHHQVHAAWSGSYLALVVVFTAFWGPTGLRASEGWYLSIAVAIGVLFGALGQRRRDQQDRIAFERERALRSLVQRSAEQQRSLVRLNAELDGVLSREVLGRQSVEAALAQIDASAGAELIAATACEEIIKLPMIDTAWVIAFEAEVGLVLAAAGQRDGPARQARLSRTETQRLLDRAASGPWTEVGPRRSNDPANGLTAVDGTVGSIWSPLKGSSGVIGVIGCGTHEPAHGPRIGDLLSAITTYGSIVGALVAPDLEARAVTATAHARIRTLLEAKAFSPFFQPIVDLRSGAVVGYEALTRFSDGTPPNEMFDLARQAGLGVELELATLTAAIDAGRALDPRAYIGLNASPELLHGGALRSVLGDVDRQIVLEITEHMAIDDYGRVRAAIEALGPRVRLAVDDAGAGYASLRHILELAPQYVKLDMGLVRGVDADQARQALIAGVGFFALKRKMRLVAEGIETRAELSTLRLLGVSHGQGYLLGRPQDGRGDGPWPERIVFH